MIKDREIVDVNLSICELLAVSYTRQYGTSLAQYIYIYISSRSPGTIDVCRQNMAAVFL